MVLFKKKFLTKFLAVGVFIFCIFNIFLTPNAYAQKETKETFKIGLAVLKDNPDYYVARAAFVNFLEKQNDLNIQFIVLNSYGDMEDYRKGLERLLGENKVDLIFTTGTRSTLPAVELAKETPVIFTAVAAPVRGGVVSSLEFPGGNASGTHCSVPAYAQMKTITKTIPSVKTIGIVYTEGEPNAEIQKDDFLKAANKLNLKVLTATVSKNCKTDEEVAEATKKIVEEVDVLIALQDTSLSQYGVGMIGVANQYQVPTYVSLSQLLSQGAVFSLGSDFASLGSISGEQAVKILRGDAEISQLPVEAGYDYSFVINLTAAQKIGLDIPMQILKTASKIIK